MKKIQKRAAVKGRPNKGHVVHSLSAHPDVWAKLKAYGDGSLSLGLQRAVMSIPWPNLPEKTDEKVERQTD